MCPLNEVPPPVIRITLEGLAMPCTFTLPTHMPMEAPGASGGIGGGALFGQPLSAGQNAHSACSHVHSLHHPPHCSRSGSFNWRRVTSRISETDMSVAVKLALPSAILPS